MMDLLEFAFEAVLELIQEGCFHLIRKYVKSKFLRGVLYVLTVLLVLAVAFALVIGVIWLGCQAVLWLLDSIGKILP